MYVNAGSLFKNAVEVVKGLSSSMPVQPRRDALVGIVFAFISAEAFINEFHHLAQLRSEPTGPGWVSALADVLGESEKSRASIESKYQLAKFILTGQPFDRGASPFQEFGLLVEVRNLIVHMKPQEAVVQKDADGKLTWVEPGIMRRLQGAGIISVQDSVKHVAFRHGAGTVISDVLAEISTNGVAKWACKATSGVVNGLIDAMPPGPFASATENMYREDFRGLL